MPTPTMMPPLPPASWSVHSATNREGRPDPSDRHCRAASARVCPDGHTPAMTGSSPLIGAHDLARRLDRQPGTVTLLDVRWRLGGPPGRTEFARGHIPGASYVDLETELADPPGKDGRHPLPEPARFAAAMRRCGVRDGRSVIVYDAVSGTSAARCWWLLRYHGHADVRVLDGGLDAWVAAGGRLDGSESSAEPGDFTARPGGMPVLDADEAARVARAGRLVDVRAPERYRGEAEPVDPVAGHVPGAVNVPTAHTLDASGSLMGRSGLREVYDAVGVADREEVGVYCGSGVTAAHGVLALEVLGIKAALYAPSWSGWITDRTRPVARGCD
jgi:thiosulfate/3-mercaptopyruvate sulfurtransferase